MEDDVLSKIKSSGVEIVLFDTETTGIGEDDRLCQLSYKLLGDDDIFDELFNPGLKISYEAMSVHHIKNEDVEDKPLFKESEEYLAVKKLFESDKTYAVAHNAPFDIEMLSRENVRVSNAIDTLKIARFLDPHEKIEKKNLQFLRYYLGLDEKFSDEKIRAHDAKSDVIVLEYLFLRLFAKFYKKYGEVLKALNVMVDISSKPLILKKMPFGKYKGQNIEDVAKNDIGYLQWLEGSLRDKGETDSDLYYTLSKLI